jgi:hypothetical protein
MKKFLKTDQGFFICEECGKTHIRIDDLSRHVKYIHVNRNTKLYYDKWIKEETDGICKICGKNTDFKNFSIGYKKCCSKKCENKYKYLTTKKAILEKYGNENYNNPKKQKQTKKERYGNENYNNHEKFIKTCLEKYGYDTILRDKNKMEKAIFKKYGVENVSQNKEIFKKIQKISLNLFKDTNIWYQGSYELDFLNKYYDEYPDIQRGPSIKYVYEGKNKVYHPDFYIPSLNLVIECKNSYLMKKDKEIIEIKLKATINNGFNYILIIDKNYSNFDPRQ